MFFLKGVLLLSSQYQIVPLSFRLFSSIALNFFFSCFFLLESCHSDLCDVESAGVVCRHELWYLEISIADVRKSFTGIKMCNLSEHSAERMNRSSSWLIVAFESLSWKPCVHHTYTTRKYTSDFVPSYPVRALPSLWNRSSSDVDGPYDFTRRLAYSMGNWPSHVSVCTIRPLYIRAHLKWRRRWCAHAHGCAHAHTRNVSHVKHTFHLR